MVYAIVAVTMLVFALVDLLIRLLRAQLPKTRGAHEPAPRTPHLPADHARRPSVHILTASNERAANGAVNVPAGLFVSPGHAWVALLVDGRVRVGIDDLAVKVLGPFDGFDLPEPGAEIARGEPLMQVFRGGRTTAVLAPVSGRVSDVNPELDGAASDADPTRAWVCCLEPRDLTGDLSALVLGARSRDFYEGEISRTLELCDGRMDRVTNDAETWMRVADALLRT